jgi:hypothetical protein
MDKKINKRRWHAHKVFLAMLEKQLTPREIERELASLNV